MDYTDIKRSLESDYDIPFSVTKTVENGEPLFIICPENPGKELFELHISFKNRVRLSMDFYPQKYSANFIESMSQQPDESRKRFIKYAELLTQKGAKCSFSVNGEDLNLTDSTMWPSHWKALKLRVTKMPVFSDDNHDYTLAADEWGSLMVGMILSLADIVPVDEADKEEGYYEGNQFIISANRYERNPLNRKLCLTAKGYTCQICGMDFENKYGELGHHFIHVHHIIPVSQIGSDYLIDPVKDLIPVCPNCHAMLHRKNPPLKPEDLMEIIHNKEI